MFIPLPIVVNSIILGIFQLMLATTLGIILSIYSKVGDEHVNSIRWIQAGGLWGMWKSLLPSRNAPRSVKSIMMLTVIASLVANFLDKGLSRLIHPAKALGKPNSVVTNTPQFVKFDFPQTFSEWSTSMHVRDNVIDAMTSIINDTRNIVNAERGRVYTPRTSPYETDCRQLNTLFLNGLNDRMLLPNDGCMYLFFILTAPPTVAQEITTAKVLKRAPGRWRFIGARTPDDTFQQMYVVPGMSNGNVSCYSDRIGTRAPISLVDGVIYPPRTTTTECLNPNGEVWVLSSTWVMFSTTTAKQFRTVTSAIFEEYDELLQAMEASINSPNFPSTPVAIAELKVVNTTVDSLICISGNSTTIVGSTALSCVYSSTYAIMTKPLNTSLLISNARGGQAPGKHQLYLDAYLPNIAMTIDHIPNVLNRTRSPFSFAVMKNASSAASTYLASLGPNIYMDWDTHKLYTLFDTLDTVEGFEIPTWLFVFLITTIVLCLAFWGAAKYKLDEGYMSSLHKNIAVGIGARMGWDSPILLRFNANPMSFEGCAVVPEDRDFHK